MSPASSNVHPQAKRKIEEGKEEDQVANPEYVKRLREEENRKMTQFMDLSDDCFFHIFPYLGLAERRNLRRIRNERLMQIELQCNFHYGTLQICVNALVCDKVEIKMNAEEMKEELARLKAKTTFNRVICEGSDPYDNVNAEEIEIYGVTNDDLPRVFANRKNVFIKESLLSAAGSHWIYEGMLNRVLDVTYVKVDMADDDAGYYDMMDILDMDEGAEDVPRENQEFTRFEHGLIVREKHLKFAFVECPNGRGGLVAFRRCR